MKTFFRTLLTAAVFTATASAAFAESYTLDSIDDTVKINISVQGAGVAKVPSPALPLPPGGKARQHLNLNADHTMTGALSFFDGNQSIDLFSLTGTWYRPAGSKTIYFALDGDPTKGTAPNNGAYGALFDPGQALLMALPDFMPILFKSKVTALAPIYPATKLKTGIITLSMKGSEITGAKTNLVLEGRGMVQYCKGNPCVATGAPKDAKYGFTAATKSTVLSAP